MNLAEIKEWVEFLWPFVRPLAALLCTFTVVSFFKSIIKHACKSKYDDFYIKKSIQVMAFCVGFISAAIFLHDTEFVMLWSVGMAILNIPLYDWILNYAASKQWLPLVALLKGRKLVVRQEGTETIEKVMDDENKTVFARRRSD